MLWLRKLIVLTLLGALTLTCRAEFVAQYGAPRTEKFKLAVDGFRQARLLEGLAGYVNASVRTPSRLLLVLDECGQVNAFYNPANKAVVVCLELLEAIAEAARRDFGTGNYEALADVVAGATIFVIFHEVGHALVDTLKLPVFAREEDVVDAIATYLQLRSPNKVQVVLAAAWLNERLPTLRVAPMWAEHSLGLQRKYNILCHAFGSDPQTFGRLAQQAGLDPSRARRCSAEFNQLQSAVRSQMGRYLVN
jgi:Putative metallopeptidase